MKLRLADQCDVEALADVHRSAFEDAWSSDDIRRFSSGPAAWTLVGEEEGVIAGFLICRAIAGEAEILTLAVRPGHRRRGIAAALLAQAMELASVSAEAMLLEVASDNGGALALYEGAGFSAVGRRSAYYGRRAGGAVDALVMRRSLNSR